MRQHELVHVAKVDKPLEWVTIQSKLPVIDETPQDTRLSRSDSSSDESSDSSDDESGRSSSATADSGIWGINRYNFMFICIKLIRMCMMLSNAQHGLILIRFCIKIRTVKHEVGEISTLKKVDQNNSNNFRITDEAADWNENDWVWPNILFNLTPPANIFLLKALIFTETNC